MNWIAFLVVCHHLLYQFVIAFISRQINMMMMTMIDDLKMCDGGVLRAVFWPTL